MKSRKSVPYREINYILVCLALVLLSCALKNYLIYFVNGTVFCQYLCPSAFGREVIDQSVVISQFYQIQSAIVETSQYYLNTLFINDRLNFLSGVIAIPLIEEVIYRGPLYLSRNYSGSLLWWLGGIALVILFTLSHDKNGLALLPVFILGLSSCWLIMTTKKFWPSLTLHFLYNLYFFPITLYQIMMFGE